MKPIQKLRKGGIRRAEHKSAVAVSCNDVVDDGAGFGQHEIAVRDHGRRPDRVQRLVVGRRQHGDGIAGIALQLVGNAKLLAKPDDAFGLRLAEVMDDEHGDSCEHWISRDAASYFVINTYLRREFWSRAPDAAQHEVMRCRAGAHAAANAAACWVRLCAAALHAAARPGHETEPTPPRPSPSAPRRGRGG